MASEIVKLWSAWKRAEANLEIIAEMRTSADDGERDLWKQTRARYLLAQKAYRDAYRALSTPRKAEEHERRRAEVKSMKELKRAYGS